jgi:hypothetical protein
MTKLKRNYHKLLLNYNTILLNSCLDEEMKNRLNRKIKYHETMI